MFMKWTEYGKLLIWSKKSIMYTVYMDVVWKDFSQTTYYVLVSKEPII